MIGDEDAKFAGLENGGPNRRTGYCSHFGH